MRRVWPWLIVLALASACKREPTFDERYAATQKRIESKSKQLDAELAGQTPIPTPPVVGSTADAR